MEGVVQIAGIIDLDEAEMVAAAGADFLGFPLRLKDGREDLSEDEARAIIAAVATPSVCITYLQRAAEVASLCDALNAPWVQLHAPISSGELRSLRASRPDLGIIKSLVVTRDNLQALEQEVIDLSPHVDAFITDTYDPATGRSGATGKTHDWAVSQQLVECSPRPLILAGGLHPENVYDAIVDVKPAGVDAHTGVEAADGRKDEALVRRFVSEAARGFSALV